MGGDDPDDGKGKEGQFVIMPYLFGYQEAHSGPKEQERDPPVMVAAEAMPEGPRADGKGQGDHPIFKTGMMNDIDPQYGQTGYRQRQNGAVYGAKDGGGDSERIPIDPGLHGCKTNTLATMLQIILPEHC